MANYKRKEKKKEELYKCTCCRGCTKLCLSNNRIAIKAVALHNIDIMPCNNATEKTVKEDRLIPRKDSR